MSRPKSYFHREQRLHTPEQMFARLAQITGNRGARVAQGIEQAGYVREVAGSSPAPSSEVSGDPVILKWGKPQSHNDGGYVMTTCARFSVIKERRKDGSWGYLPFQGKTSLKGYLSTVDEAKAICQQHA